MLETRLLEPPHPAAEIRSRQAPESAWHCPAFRSNPAGGDALRSGSDASRDLWRAPFHRARPTPRSRHPGTHRCHRPRGDGECLRLRPLVLPRGVASRPGADRSRVRRRRRGHGKGRARRPEGRFRRRAFHVQRWHMPALPRRVAVELRPWRFVREPRRRRRPGRSGARSFRGRDARPGSGVSGVGRGHGIAAHTHGRHVHGSPCGDERRREER